MAFLIDLFGTFFIFTFAVAALTGDIVAEKGQLSAQLDNGPALLCIVLVIAYFVIMNKWLGGTLGKRLMGIAVPKKGPPPMAKAE